MYFNDFYRNKKVLITGHTGFKGSWLAIWLKELGANVVGYALDPYTEKDNYVLAGLQNEMVDIRGDIKDLAKLESVFQQYKPEIVFHLAAQPLVRLSYESPRETFEDNVMGTVNVLECVRKSKSVKIVVNITSDKCYDNKEWIWGYKETDAMGGYDPYSASKGCSELVVNAYINSFFNPENYDSHQKAVVSVRAGNVIGGGDWSKDRIIPDCIRSIEKKTAIQVRSPYSVRPWQHVLEPLSGYLWLGAQLTNDPKKYIGNWNFGPTNDAIISVKEVVTKILENFPAGEWEDVSSPNQPHEARLLNLDCSKAHFILNWKPSMSVEKCIKLTCDWYKEYTNENVYQLCKKQINSYTSCAVERNIAWTFSK
ncbi:CDP-glucose 4,6-dehydratase [Paenibacillus filicis]|uniref:CDP-glucose 4,6-dehydratase n=1 Tax=Paenibacillus gyeongsangnamensis TaxID=3388067 RepID=A0ABT4Q6Q9_9BACL|nr:CDP-glucose 4,6-dehydratase [Paenibacillus filicis]MCZ8512561.1 CDP-glucose 4,6-dehydratase [Paenibacillus filicis]